VRSATDGRASGMTPTRTGASATGVRALRTIRDVHPHGDPLAGLPVGERFGFSVSQWTSPTRGGLCRTARNASPASRGGTAVRTRVSYGLPYGLPQPHPYRVRTPWPPASRAGARLPMRSAMGVRRARYGSGESTALGRYVAGHPGKALEHLAGHPLVGWCQAESPTSSSGLANRPDRPGRGAAHHRCGSASSRAS